MLRGDIGRLTRCFEEKTTLTIADELFQQRCYLRGEIDVTDTCVCFRVKFDPTSFFASLLANINYRAIVGEVLSYFEAQRFGDSETRNR